jgi:predicted DNA-binding transcriptional regulator AlpA
MPAANPPRSSAFETPRLVRQDEVLTQTGLRPTSLRNLMAAEKFPKNTWIGPQTKAWRADEVDSWIRDRLAERN